MPLFFVPAHLKYEDIRLKMERKTNRGWTQIFSTEVTMKKVA